MSADGLTLAEVERVRDEALALVAESEFGDALMQERADLAETLLASQRALAKIASSGAKEHWAEFITNRRKHIIECQWCSRRWMNDNEEHHDGKCPVVIAMAALLPDGKEASDADASK